MCWTWLKISGNPVFKTPGRFIYNIILSDQYRYMHDTCTGIKLKFFYKNIDLPSKNCLNDTFAVLKTS